MTCNSELTVFRISTKENSSCIFQNCITGIHRRYIYGTNAVEHFATPSHTLFSFLQGSTKIGQGWRVMSQWLEVALLCLKGKKMNVTALYM